MAPDLLDRIDDLLPVLRSRREEIEAARRLPPDLAPLLRATGVFALGVPRAIGGSEASLSDLMHVIERVSSADGSTGWCTMIGITSSIAAGYMNEPGAKQIFADPNVICAAIAAPTGHAVA